MNNKKILLAITPGSVDTSLFDFLSRILDGNNLHITICQIYPEKLDSNTGKELRAFLGLCTERSIPFEIKNFEYEPIVKLKSEMTFSDIFILQKEALQTLSFENVFDSNFCPSIVVPNGFNYVSNIVLALDGTRKSLYAIKQFFQVFSREMENLNMTLLDISGLEKSQLSIEEESMLISYLKLYNSNLAVLKVKHPVSEINMNSLGINDGTFVVGTSEFLLSQKGARSPFNPFYDLRTAVFMPALYE